MDFRAWVFLLSVFAVYRAARLVSIDYGPFDVCLRLRTFLGIRAARQTPVRSNLTKTLADLVNCPHCVGLWVSIVPALFLAPTVWWFFVYWFGIAGVQSFLHTLVGDDREQL